MPISYGSESDLNEIPDQPRSGTKACPEVFGVIPVKGRVEIFSHPAGAPPREPGAMMKRLHTFLNRHFFHPNNIRAARIWGLYERETTVDPAELLCTDQTLDILRRGFEERHDPAGDFCLQLIKNGVAPRYVYPSVDVILAFEPFLAEMKTRPLKMTSCLDECVLLASLALALGCCTLEEIVFVGSPFHYTLFLFPNDKGFLFNAKRELFSKDRWIEEGGDKPDRSESMLREKLLVWDRIISPEAFDS